MSLRDAVSHARVEIEEATQEPNDAPSQDVAKAVDDALDALDLLAAVLDEESAQAFLDSHLQVIHVELPEKKHTIVGIGMRADWPPQAAVRCSCEWGIDRGSAGYVGVKVAEHLGKPEKAREWIERASLDFTGRWS